jgi:tetratricopeptide (TPR) repeat protein
MRNEEKDDKNVTDENFHEEDPFFREEFTMDDPELEFQPNSEWKRWKVPAWVILFMFIVITLDIISLISFPSSLEEYKIYKTAEKRITAGETSLALNDLYELAEKHNYSIPIMIKTIELSMEYGYYDMAGYLYDTYLIGRELSDSEYNKVDQYYTRLESYYKTYDSVDQIVTTVTSMNLTQEQMNIEMKQRLQQLLNESGQDYAYVYYYLGVLEDDRERSLSYLLKTYDLDPEFQDIRVQLGVAYRRMGDYKTAKQYNEEALQRNKLDSGALRSAAILAMLEGDLTRGLNYAEEAYQAYPDGVYVRETYLIALSLNDKDAEAEAIEKEMQSLNETVEDETNRLIDGEITLEEYYVEG